MLIEKQDLHNSTGPRTPFRLISFLGFSSEILDSVPHLRGKLLIVQAKHPLPQDQEMALALLR